MDELPPLIVPKKPVGLASQTGFVPIDVEDKDKASPAANQLSDLVRQSRNLMKVKCSVTLNLLFYLSSKIKSAWFNFAQCLSMPLHFEGCVEGIIHVQSAMVQSWNNKHGWHVLCKSQIIINLLNNMFIVICFKRHIVYFSDNCIESFFVAGTAGSQRQSEGGGHHSS